MQQIDHETLQKKIRSALVAYAMAPYFKSVVRELEIERDINRASYESLLYQIDQKEKQCGPARKDYADGESKAQRDAMLAADEVVRQFRYAKEELEKIDAQLEEVKRDLKECHWDTSLNNKKDLLERVRREKLELLNNTDNVIAQARRKAAERHADSLKKLKWNMDNTESAVLAARSEADKLAVAILSDDAIKVKAEKVSASKLDMQLIEAEAEKLTLCIAIPILEQFNDESPVFTKTENFDTGNNFDNGGAFDTAHTQK